MKILRAVQVQVSFWLIFIMINMNHRRENIGVTTALSAFLVKNRESLRQEIFSNRS